MIYNLPDYIIIANALYSKKTNILNYDEIEKYKVILYQTITEKYKYIMFDYSTSSIIEVNNHTFIKLNEGVLSMSEIDKSFIEKINSIYPKDIRELIEKSRDIYIKTNKELVMNLKNN